MAMRLLLVNPSNPLVGLANVAAGPRQGWTAQASISFADGSDAGGSQSC